MTQMTNIAIPSHVPPDRVVEFDLYGLAPEDGDVQAAWYKLKQSSPSLFWTPCNGGHWVSTRARDIKAIQIDHERFSNSDTNIPRGRRPFPMPPIDSDPPAHFAYRLILSPAFAPRMTQALSERAREVMRGAVANVKPHGECEFISAVAKVLPIQVFLGLMDLPSSDAALLLPLADAVTGEADIAVAHEARRAMAEYLEKRIADRREKPGDDLISRVVHAKIEDRMITKQEALGMCVLLLGGGLDTVAALLGFTTRFLAISPKHRERLVSSPELIPKVLDEIIRRFGIANVARVVTQDVQVDGVWMKAGDQVQIPNCLYGLDTDIVADPLEVDFDRPTDHAAFGNGPHRCPGAILARSELRIFLEEWLREIPTFSLQPGAPVIAKSGLTNTMRALHLRWPV